ncbi:MAG: LD-carboxypeptidase [Anaerolineales bacterium]|nr:LD-carboxypeptidase [Anaerolineales bacterium]
MNRREFMRFAAGLMALGAVPVWHAGSADGRDGIRYPSPLRRGDTIGITAPSAGVGPALEPRLTFCLQALQDLGFRIREGHCLRSDKMASAPAQMRADELQAMLLDDSIRAILPPWGGEILIDLLPLLDWEALAAPKWIIGYSDLSTFMAPYTLRTHCHAERPNYPKHPSAPPTPLHWTHVRRRAFNIGAEPGDHAFEPRAVPKAPSEDEAGYE